jgi:hypothetical protein
MLFELQTHFITPPLTFPVPMLGFVLGIMPPMSPSQRGRDVVANIKGPRRICCIFIFFCLEHGLRARYRSMKAVEVMHARLCPVRLGNMLNGSVIDDCNSL